MKPIKELVADLKASYPRIEEAIPGLKRKSDKEYCGACPNPGCKVDNDGFLVFPKTQKFWCRGCECHGDIIEYYRMTGHGDMMQQLETAGLLEDRKEASSAGPTRAKGKDNLPAYIWGQSKNDADAAAIISKAFAFRSIQLEQIPPNIRLNSYKGQLSIACAMRHPSAAEAAEAPEAVHLTLLDAEGRKCETRYQGAKKGLAVMLPGKDRSRLVIGEGLETTLSAMQAMGFSVMVCGDAGNMAGVSRLPEQFQEIFILVDSDPSHAGQKAALDAAESIGKANPKAAVWLVAPDDSCFTDSPEKLDFNDLLMKDPSGELIKSRFEKKQRLDEIDWRPKEKEQAAKAAEPDNEWFLVEQGEKGKLKLAAQSRAAQVISEMTYGKFMYAPDIQHWHHFTGTHWANDSKNDAFGRHLVSLLEKGAGGIGFNAAYLHGVEVLMTRSGRHKSASENNVSLVPFCNGVLNPETGLFERTTPDNALRWCLPYEYKPDAECPLFDVWLDTVCDDDTGGLQKLIIASINVCLMERPDLQFFIHLQGDPGTGKGTLARLLQAIVGSQGFWKSDFELLENDKFEPANYYQKRLLQFDEVPAHVKVNKFNQLTGRDRMRIEEKNKQADQHFIFTGLVLLLGNSLFSTDDQTTFAIERRRLTVQLNRILSEEEKTEFAEADGENALHKEIPGIINKALRMSREQVTEIFYRPPVKVTEANMAAEEVSSPVVKFITEHVRYDPAGKVYPGSKKEYSETVEIDGKRVSKRYYERQEDRLYPRYLAWCDHMMHKPLSPRRFIETAIKAINKRLVPEGGSPVEKGKHDRIGDPIIGIALVPWPDTGL